MPDALNSRKTVAILGAGPVGLAAAAHVLERGMNPRVLEAGPEVGHAVRQWSHVRMFSPWEYNVDKASERLLLATGWNTPQPDHYPTGGELVEQYLEPLASRTPLKDHIQTNSKVVSAGRVGFDKVKTKGREYAPFEIRYQNGSGVKSLHADAVIDASGTWASPNPAGATGLRAVGEAELGDRIVYGMPDVRGSARGRFAGKTIAVLGAGHSAIGTLIELAQIKAEHPETVLLWLLRGGDPEKAFGGGANDKLAVRGALGSAFAELVRNGTIKVEVNFHVSHVTLADNRLRIGAGSSCCGRSLVVDELVVATGFRPALDFIRELRIALDPALECPPELAPLIDPNLHSCGTVRPHGARELSQPEPGFYFAGMKSYGRAPTFLMLTGYEQVRSVAAELAGDLEAARRVELVLPETGVCSTAGATAAAEVCCGDAKPVVTASCCGPAEPVKAATSCRAPAKGR